MEKKRHDDPKPAEGNHKERVIRTSPEEEQLKALGVFPWRKEMKLSS